MPTITWVSDIAAVLHCGFEPVFVDIDPRTLGMDIEQVLGADHARTRAVFLTHVLGYNALSRRLLDELQRRGVPLFEDVCESHGATFEGRKLGAFGLASNFSFYYAHHLSTIEGGMVCTNDADLYETVRMLRSHGMVRELDSVSRRREYADEYPELNPEFIFACPGYNVRSTEINAVIGRSQLPRLERGHPPPHGEPAAVPRRTSTPRLYQHRFRDRRQQQLRPHADPQGRRRRPVAARHDRPASNTASSSAAARPAAATRSASRICASSWGRTRGRKYPQADHVHFLRLLHRQLSVPGARTRCCGCATC